MGRAAAAVVAFVVVATAFYALAFVNMYRTDHPGAQASDWMTETAPAGSVVLTDNHWDEGFRDLGRFSVSQLPMYERDTAAKSQQLAERLAGADYIMAYSNRPWGSIVTWSESVIQSSSARNDEATLRTPSFPLRTQTPENGVQGVSSFEPCSRQATPPDSALPYISVGGKPICRATVAALLVDSAPPEENTFMRCGAASPHGKSVVTLSRWAGLATQTEDSLTALNNALGSR